MKGKERTPSCVAKKVIASVLLTILSDSKTLTYPPPCPPPSSLSPFTGDTISFSPSSVSRTWPFGDSEVILSFRICRMATGPGLEPLVDQLISVITNDGRNIVGILKGFDQAINIILDESHERVFSTKEGVQQIVLGLYIIRGDNISVIGELDEDLDAHIELSQLRGHPLKPVIH